LIEEAIDKKIKKKGKKIKPNEKEALEKIMQDAENYEAEELDKCIVEHKIKAPDTGNDLTGAVPFNLMFSSQIGPTGHMQGYLRPETAQGIFLNFIRLNEFNHGKMPFASAQIGLGFRNEIHPRQGLLRVREFQMAEIEHFVDPNDKSHHKFFTVENMKLPLWSDKLQEENGPAITDITLKQALEQKIIGSQTVAYFMARTYLFLTQNGVHKEGVRFRQHRCNEMAHYAQECWDAEVECSYGWIEVAGHSDRSCFDLTRHAEYTKKELVAARPLKTPIKVKRVRQVLDKQKIGKALKKDSKPIIEMLETLTQEKNQEYANQM
jgi:glycyl-tRNA synthetase